MSDDAWIHELAEASRDEGAASREQLDERWSRLSGPDLSAQEEAELRALSETSPEALEAYEAFRPLGPDFKQQTLRVLRELIAAEDPAPLVARPRAPWRFLPAHIPALARWSAAGAVVMVAAILVLRLPRGASPALPGYTGDLKGGVEDQRGGRDRPHAGVQTFRQGGQLELVLKPDSAVRREIVATCFLVHGRKLRPCQQSVRKEEQGVVRVVGRVTEDLRLEPGDWTLCAVVGWPRQAPDAEALCARPGQPGPTDRSWRIWKFPLRVE